MRITVLVDSFVKGSIGYDRECFLVKGRNAQWSSLYWDSSSYQSFHSHEPNLPCFVFKTCWSFHWKLKCSCISGISCISRSVQSWVCPALPFMRGFTSLSCCTQSITSVLFTPKWLPDQLVDKHRSKIRNTLTILQCLLNLFLCFPLSCFLSFFAAQGNTRIKRRSIVFPSQFFANWLTHDLCTQTSVLRVWLRMRRSCWRMVFHPQSTLPSFIQP